jgi:hypothetical protein
MRMTPETLFMIANPLALMGWLALAIAPLAPRLIDLFAGWVLPGLLSLGYAVLMLVHFADAPGGFQTLAAVQALFTDGDVALAGWMHYLAFDLFIGAWILRDARREGFAHWVVLPILPFVFLVGPAGFVAYVALKLLRRGIPSTDTELRHG